MKSFKIVLLGAGNLAFHLGMSLREAVHDVLEVYNRSEERGKELANQLGSQYVGNLSDISRDADIYILAVADDALEEVASHISVPGKTVIHTSGARSMTLLKQCSDQHGVMWPLHSFVKNQPLNMKQVPVFITASDENTSSSILELASSISDRVQVVSEEKRKVIHLSAVFANNFTNYLYTVAYDLMKESGLSFNDMLPIISESAARLSASDPAEIQAGPAFRNDTKTMEEHEELLRDHPEYKQIYEMMSENIRKLRSNNK